MTKRNMDKLDYKEMKNSKGEITTGMIRLIDEDGTLRDVPNNERNRHWQEFKEWKKLGKKPKKAD